MQYCTMPGTSDRVSILSYMRLPTRGRGIDEDHATRQLRSAIDCGLNYLIRLSGAVAGPRAAASLCRRCGRCVEACPQGAAVPDRLAEVAQRFEDWRLAARTGAIRLVLPLQRWLATRAGRRR